VSTLGFHETRVTRPVLQNGLDNSDVVRDLRPETEGDEQRAQEAIDHVEELLTGVAPSVTIALECIDTADLPTAVQQCGAVIQSADGTVIVNFGGGAREVFMPFSIAATMYASDIDQALQYTDIDEEVRELTLPRLTATIPKRARSTLKRLAAIDGEISISELADRTDKTSSTVGRHLESLEAEGLVSTRTAGRAKYGKLTPTGRLLADQL
jgi:CRISPR-associated protein Csa3